MDSRFITADADFLACADQRIFLGKTGDDLELRVNLPANRLRGEAVLRRTTADASQAVTADFAIYASPTSAIRFPRWSARIELRPGQLEAVVPYAIDGSHLPTAYTVTLPAQGKAGLAAGWFNPTITDVGGDSAVPAWLNRTDAPVLTLNEPELARVLPGSWRPVSMQLRQGRITPAGLELSPGGEIWIHVQGMVSRLSGMATLTGTKQPAVMPNLTAFWYKAGRLQLYAPPRPEDRKTGTTWFQSWCAEPDGWLVIALGPEADRSPVSIKITEVTKD